MLILSPVSNVRKASSSRAHILAQEPHNEMVGACYSERQNYYPGLF